jgi:hypothetical protein
MVGSSLSRFHFSGEEVYLPVRSILLLLLVILLAACRESPEATVVASAGVVMSTPTRERPRDETAPALLATSLPTATPALDMTRLPDSTSAPTELSIAADDVQVFPVPMLISGDRVTFMVQPDVPPVITVENVPVEIYVDGELVSASTLGWRNWAGGAQGVYEWVWDTTGRAGLHEVRVVLDSQDMIREGDADPSDNEIVFSVRVGKVDGRPLEERDASWITAETDCCTVHAMTRTAAFRDFPELLSLADAAVSEAASRLNEFPEEKIDLYFVDRTIGQGGYAGKAMVIVYNDRPYIGGELYELLKHEVVHIIDRQFAPQRIELLAEGVAVWAAGGHYEAQDLQERMAALLQLNAYVPLAQLADNFYPAQHEIGYLEAGAFVDFLVARYGWPAVRTFYSNTSASDGSSPSVALDVNLQSAFGRTLAELEATWLESLQALPVSDEAVADLRSTIRYYEAARNYQQRYDRSAYFRTAWLPYPADVIETGNPADFIRRPETEVNVLMEVMLRAAHEAITDHDYERANVLLDSIERFLNDQNELADPLVSSYQNIVRTAMAFGYDPQRVLISGGSADVLATTATGHTLIDLDLQLQRGDWILRAN